jgi:hypothetical protein
MTGNQTLDFITKHAIKSAFQTLTYLNTKCIYFALKNDFLHSQYLYMMQHIHPECKSRLQVLFPDTLLQIPTVHLRSLGQSAVPYLSKMLRSTAEYSRILS